MKTKEDLVYEQMKEKALEQLRSCKSLYGKEEHSLLAKKETIS